MMYSDKLALVIVEDKMLVVLHSLGRIVVDHRSRHMQLSAEDILDKMFASVVEQDTVVADSLLVGSLVVPDTIGHTLVCAGKIDTAIADGMVDFADRMTKAGGKLVDDVAVAVAVAVVAAAAAVVVVVDTADTAAGGIAVAGDTAVVFERNVADYCACLLLC